MVIWDRRVVHAFAKGRDILMDYEIRFNPMAMDAEDGACACARARACRGK